HPLAVAHHRDRVLLLCCIERLEGFALPARRKHPFPGHDRVPAREQAPDRPRKDHRLGPVVDAQHILSVNGSSASSRVALVRAAAPEPEGRSDSRPSRAEGRPEPPPEILALMTRARLAPFAWRDSLSC